MEINVGAPFAFAFFSPAVQRTHQNATCAFSSLKWSHIIGAHQPISYNANILWRAGGMDERDEVTRLVTHNYPGASLRGVFTTTSHLIVVQGDHRIHYLGIVGPSIALDDFQDGPIRRADAPNAEQARGKILDLTAFRARRAPRL